jgi:predicted nucleotidyltransferase
MQQYQLLPSWTPKAQAQVRIFHCPLLWINDSICYMSVTSIEQLKAQARAADLLHARSRKMLVDAVRAGVKAGLSQREIAAAVRRSQPEVSRLVRFQGDSPLGRKLRKHRAEVIKIAKEHGARDLKVFGSVVTGKEHKKSDIDLLATFDRGMTLMGIVRLEFALGELLGVEVDVVSEKSLRPFLRDRVLGEAVPL